MEPQRLRPRLSIVIPSRNRGALLIKVLRALEGQRGVDLADLEVLVVLDGDSDQTADRLRAETFAFGLQVLEQVHAGVACARNLGWQRAQAEHVLFIDDDMLALPQLAAAHLHAHAEHPRAAVLGRFSPNRAERRSPWTRYDEAVQEKRYALYEGGERPTGVRCYSGNLSLPTALLEEVGGFDANLVRNEDVDLGFRLQERGVQIIFASQAETLHCGHHELKGWLKMPVIYGRLDVAIYRDRGYRGGVQTIVAGYHDRHPANRLLIRLALGAPMLKQVLVATGVRIGLAADRLGMQPVSFAAFSMVCNILYWTGIRDGLRGNAAFWRMVHDTRRYPLRSYERIA